MIDSKSNRSEILTIFSRICLSDLDTDYEPIMNHNRNQGEVLCTYKTGST